MYNSSIFSDFRNFNSIKVEVFVTSGKNHKLSDQSEVQDKIRDIHSLKFNHVNFPFGTCIFASYANKNM